MLEIVYTMVKKKTVLALMSEPCDSEPQISIQLQTVKSAMKKIQVYVRAYNRDITIKPRASGNAS